MGMEKIVVIRHTYTLHITFSCMEINIVIILLVITLSDDVTYNFFVVSL